MARVRTNQASALVCQSVEEAGRGAGGAREAEALQRRAWVVLVAFALPALHSRVVAGTLLPGRCRPAEEAFYDVEQRQQPTAGEDSGAEPAPPSAASLRRGAACVGYATALDAAHCALNLLPLHGWRGDQRARAHAFVLALLVDLVPHTAGLRLRFGGEDDLADVVECRADPECYDPTFWAALQAAWTSPPCAGVLRARGALRRGDDARAAAGAEAAARLAAGVAAAPAAAGAVAPGGGLLRCGLPSCGRREARALQFRVRGHCPALRYCCAEHAKQHWPAAHAHAPPEGGAGEAGGERNGGGTAAA